MKYWAYLNDDVSQKSYSEEELQKLPGFGPDILICSEVSAVSKDPEWKPVKELLPHLIRPKAPDFAKFRPKPPVPQQQDNDGVLPVPEALPSGVNATPLEQQPQVSGQNNNSGLDPNLLAQLQSLTAKIVSLEDKIVEQEKELESHNDPDIADIDAEETFVSEPQNEQEDDVLEVPFENDFEIPFDANKSSEEIAKEAEAMLAKDSTEIEEYDTDDQNTEFMNYNSDMQKILEDTIRETNFYPSEANKPHKEKKASKDIIAEDLISRKTLNLSEKLDESKEQNKAPKQEVEHKEEATEQVENNETAEEQKAVNTKDNTEETPQEQVQEPVEEESTQETVQETEQEENQEQQEEVSQEQEQDSQQTNEIKSLDDLYQGDEENTAEEKQEEPEQVTEPQLVSVNEAPEGAEIPVQAEEEQPEPQLASVEDAPEGQAISVQTENENTEPQLVSVDEVPQDEDTKETEYLPESQEPIEEEKAEEPVEEKPVEEESTQETEQESEQEPEQESLEEEKQEPEQEPEQESLEEEKQEEENHEEEKQEEDSEELQVLPVEEDITQEEKTEEPVEEGSTQETEQEPEQETEEQETSEEEKQEELPKEELDNLKTVALDELSDDNVGQLEVAEESENKLDQQEDEEKNQEESENSFEDDQVVNSVADKVEVPVEFENNLPSEQTSNMITMTQGVTLSEDATTAAVLNEIAEEKAQDVKAMTTSDKLFVELENTYKSEEDKNKENNSSEVKVSDAEQDLDEDIAKEDEFLKTFTTSVEEVFLDQPTAIISDYVPPNSDGENHARPDISETNIKREKPSDIKTVPLVPGNLGEEIWSSPYVESGTAKLGKTSMLSNWIKWIIIIAAVAIISAGALSALAVMGIIPEGLSPIHTVIYSLQKTPQTNDTLEESDFAPEVLDQNVDVEPNYAVEENRIDDVIGKVKNYNFADGTTLEGRINFAHKNLTNEIIEWSLFPTEEQGVYSVAVRIPQNKDGQGFSYRFNYNMTNNILTPTTSEAKNLMES